MVAILKTTQIQEPSSATVNLTLDTSGGVAFGNAIQVGGSAGTSGQYLRSAGAGASPTWATLSSSGALIRAPQFLTTTGAGTYTTPSNCTAIYCEMLGGGGGGGGVATTNGSAGGGGGGGYGMVYITVTGSTAYTISVGAGGTAGTTAGSAGGTGGTTSIIVGATTYSALGGVGGNGSTGGSTSNAGGAGGSTSNLTLSSNGGTGGTSGNTTNGVGGIPTYLYLPFGGGSLNTSGNQGNNGLPATYYGCGGSGGISSAGAARTGGVGYQGYMRIWEFT